MATARLQVEEFRPVRGARGTAQRRPEGSSLMWEVARHTGDDAHVDEAWRATVRSRAWMLDELGREDPAQPTFNPAPRPMTDDWRVRVPLVFVPLVFVALVFVTVVFVNLVFGVQIKRLE